MKETKIIIYLLFICLICLFVSGCSNYNEINNVMVVDGIGIDKIDGKYIVSFNTYVGNDKYEVYDVSVDALDNSFNDIYLLVNKKIFLSHLNILYLSSNLDNSDILDIVNTFNNREDLRGSFLVSMVNGYSNKVFSNTSIYTLIENNHKESGVVYPTTFNDIISDYLEMDISYIPVINNDLSIIGMHSLFSEHRFYNNDEASYLNLVTNKLDSYVFDIDNEEVRLNDIDVCFSIDSNNVSINVKAMYISNLNEKEISSFLLDNINSLLELDINYNYFINLIKKKDYSYFNNHKDISISFDINIYLNKDELNNIKDGDLIEKSS